MKPVIDYAQSRRRLLGIADLGIQTVFDIGANIGKKSKHYRKLFPEAKIYCFEPVPSTFERLNTWAKRQHGAVEAFNIALGSERGATTMLSNVTHSGGSTMLRLHNPDESYVEVPVRVETLDAVAERLDVRGPVFVKIDVEGFDMEVIKGGTQLLSHADAVMIEIALPQTPTDLPTFPQFMHVMTELGYLYRGNLAHAYVEGTAQLADAVFIRPSAARLAA